MDLDEILHNFHFNIDKAIPSDWEVDWDDAPLPYKLYRGLPGIPLSLEVPLTLENRKAHSIADLCSIGHFLWYAFGLTQLSESFIGMFSIESAEDLMYSHRRFVPSGGALYPNELYIYLKVPDLPAGIYHYDMAHHQLVLLRKGNFDSYISRSLGNRCNVSDCFGIAFVSTMFWKNFFKYHNFAYRLQGLDAGVLIGQILEVAKRFGFSSGVYYQFLDRAVNHLLGLSEQEESVYAVIPLSSKPKFDCIDRSGPYMAFSSTDLCRELPAIQPAHYVRSRKVLEYPVLMRLNEASMMETTGSFQQIKMEKNKDTGDHTVALPPSKRLTHDFASVCRKRFSPDMDFILGKVSCLELATLLKEAMDSFPYRNDLDEVQGEQTSRISLYCSLYNIGDLPAGAYQYDHAVHALRRVQLGDHRLRLQSGMSGSNVNMFQIPVCLHVAGRKDYFKKAMGYRGYRIQQMEAGILVQKILLAAAALGMGGHPLLGFDAKLCDELYEMGQQGKTCLIQIPVGPYRNRPWLRGNLHS